MFGNPMLGVAIGLIFLYLMLSIIVTVLQEFIASFLKWRSKNLKTAIVELIGDPNKKVFFEHPLIFPLFRGDVDQKGDPIRGGPSYIPKRNFALAVLNLLATDKASRDPQPGRALPPPAFAVARFIADAASGVGLNERIRRFDETASQLIAKIQDATEREIRKAMETLTDAGYPIGWRGWQGNSWLPQGQPGQNFTWAVFGMLLTALAMSLGSSFWFDLLGKFMNVRMTGKAEDTATPSPAPSSGGEKTS